MADRPVRESIREIDGDAWLIGNRFLLLRAPLEACTWADGKGGGFRLSDAPIPLPKSRPLPDTSEIKLVYDAGDVSDVFSIGEAFCKIRIPDVRDMTRENITLAWLHEHTLSFAIPDVLHHAEYDGRYLVILTRVVGETIDTLWPKIDDATKQRYAERVANICQELAVPSTGNSVCGIDGHSLPERYLAGSDLDCSPSALRQSCLRMGMACSSLVFCHCDLGPGNVLVDVASDTIGVIDWEIAGFVPQEWIRTKFCVCSGMDLSSGDTVDWRRRVSRRLGAMGFAEVIDGFCANS